MAPDSKATAPAGAHGVHAFRFWLLAIGMVAAIVLTGIYLS